MNRKKKPWRPLSVGRKKKEALKLFSLKGINFSKKKLLLVVLFIFGLLLCNFLFFPLFSLLKEARALPKAMRPLKEAVTGNDFRFFSSELQYFRSHLEKIDKSADKLKIFAFVPYFGPYFSDLKTMSSVSLDLLDVSDELSTSVLTVIPDLKYVRWGVKENFSRGEKSNNLANLSSILVQELPNYKDELSRINKAFSSISPQRYPSEIRGIKMREYLQEMQNLSSNLTKSFDDLINLVKFVPELAGEEGPRNYLVYLQNNNKLTPSGGIPIAYSVFTTNQGKLLMVKSTGLIVDDKVGLDSNSFSADFKVFAEAEKNRWSRNQNFPINGVMVVDIHFIRDLLDIVGGIGVPDYGSFTKNNVATELEKFTSLGKGNSEEDKRHKNAISYFLYELMGKVFTLNSRQKIQFLETVFQEIPEKHFLVYFDNQGLQDLVEKYNFGGRIKDFQGDYLYMSDSKINGGSGQIDQTITKIVSTENGNIVSTLSVVFENLDTASQNPYREEISFFVPKGSKLLSSSDNFTEVSTTEENNKTVFRGRISVNPKSKINVTLKYNLPSGLVDSSNYSLFIQKQPGVDAINFNTDIFSKKDSFSLTIDKEINFLQ